MHSIAEFISYSPFFSMLLGLLGLGLAGVCILWLGKSNPTGPQKVLIILLGSLTFIFWIIFGLFNFGLENGSTFNFGLFQMDYWYSEGLMLLLVAIAPLILAVLNIIRLRQVGWVKRLAIPIALAIGVAAINYLQLYALIVKTFVPV